MCFMLTACDQACYIEEDTANEYIRQELPFLSDDLSNIFMDCKISAPPPRPATFTYPPTKPSLYCYVRLKDSVKVCQII